MTSGFQDELRDRLVVGADRYRRRRRTKRLAAGAAAVAALALVGLLVGGPDRDQTVRSDVGAISTTTIHQPEPSTTLGPPLADDDARAATETVAAFLGALRAGDDTGASALWSGYPDGLGTASGESEARKLAAIGQLRTDLPWLATDPAPALTAAAAPTWGSVVPVVTVTASTPDGSRAAAFVLDRADGAGNPAIERPPTSAEPPRVSVDQGTGIATIRFDMAPMEGGARVYLDGAEVPAAVDTKRLQVVIDVPAEGVAGAVATVVVATPEVAAAAAFVLDALPD